MEINAENTYEIQEFGNTLRCLLDQRDAGALERATELAKTMAVQDNFNDFGLFMECIYYFKNLRRTVDHDDTHLAAFKLLLVCPALDISKVPIMDFYGDMFFLPEEISLEMLRKLQPTDAHIQELLDYYSRPRCCKNMVMASDYLAWSLGKVSDLVWLALLDIQVPFHQDDHALFLKELLSYLVKDLGSLKRMLVVANNNGYDRASRFLSPIVGIINFLAATSDIDQNDQWLPADVLALIIELLRVEMLIVPEYSFSL